MASRLLSRYDTQAGCPSRRRTTRLVVGGLHRSQRRRRKAQGGKAHHPARAACRYWQLYTSAICWDPCRSTRATVRVCGSLSDRRRASRRRRVARSVGSAATSNSGPRIRRHAAAVHQIERARMSSPLAAVRLSIASDGSSSTVDPSVDTSSRLRRHLSWIASA